MLLFNTLPVQTYGRAPYMPEAAMLRHRTLCHKERLIHHEAR
ncbi:hypothetical protein [Acetobacter syzygii]|nr:hypothetical protein [Acetobacter syzygii]